MGYLTAEEYESEQGASMSKFMTYDNELTSESSKATLK
jgi:hypothetical protein